MWAWIEWCLGMQEENLFLLSSTVQSKRNDCLQMCLSMEQKRENFKQMKLVQVWQNNAHIHLFFFVLFFSLRDNMITRSLLFCSNEEKKTDVPVFKKYHCSVHWNIEKDVPYRPFHRRYSIARYNMDRGVVHSPEGSVEQQVQMELGTPLQFVGDMNHW